MRARMDVAETATSELVKVRKSRHKSRARETQRALRTAGPQDPPPRAALRRASPGLWTRLRAPRYGEASSGLYLTAMTEPPVRK